MKRFALSTVQHVLAAFIAFALAITFAGSSIVITGVRGNYSYNLYESDRTRQYEESNLFNNILGNNLAEIIRLVAERSMLETNGEYDGDKLVDVTAYVNRQTTLPGDYVTAVYCLSDLIKWAQNGFEYQTRDFTEEESSEFLNYATTYTRIDKNIVSGGMNSYLSSQVEDNTHTFTISGNSTNGAGSHTVLKSRYLTIDGKNVENIVSTWEEYNTLCSNIDETGKAYLSIFEDYGELLDYYSYSNSNLRYYITRTISGKTEVYTNVDDLKGETTGIDIGALFESYGKYIYYCPYELDYKTNTLLTENVVRYLIKNYSYAYPDMIKVYIGVDTNNYPCIDDFTKGRSNFSKYMPYRTQLLILCIFALIVYIVLFVINLRLKVNAKKKNVLTEAIILLGITVMAIPILINILISYILGLGMSLYIQYRAFPIIAALSVFFMDMGFLYLVYGLVDQSREGFLWKKSATRNICIGARNVIVNATDNGNIIIRTWIPFVAFVTMNILLVLLGISGIIIAIFFDILVGIFIYRQNSDRDKIIHVIENIKNGDVKAKVVSTDFHGDNIALADAVNSIGDGIDEAVNTSMRDEKLKADLITNVSHDIKTPLTSIINYVDLIKRENIENDKVKEYLEVLDVKSQKLKQLTEDLVEASKISSGNINIELGKINFVELLNQTLGEFHEKFENSNLQYFIKSESPEMYIMADPRHLWRVLENLVNNVCKYALSGTRVYFDMRFEGAEDAKRVVLSIKNISARALDIDADELTERFIRGDVSRTTEGSGLGLSIAKNLTLAQGGTFDIKLDGDLFKVIISLEAC